MAGRRRKLASEIRIDATLELLLAQGDTAEHVQRMSIDERLSSALADRYTIERELGKGGMATVYLSTDLKHNRRFALNVLRPAPAAVVWGRAVSGRDPHHRAPRAP